MAKPNRKNNVATEAKDLPGQAVDLQEEVEREELAPPPAVVEITPTADELIKQYGNKSNAIRALNSEGKTRSEIAKLLGIRYQHVNNVLNQVLKRPIKAERAAEKNGIVLEADLPVAQSINAVVKS